MKNCRNGFTLIEVLVVLVVVGILAAVAVSGFSSSRQKAYVAAMTADLHAAAIYEEIYATTHDGNYFSGTATSTSALEGFQTSPGVTVTLTALIEMTSSGSALPGWTAVARHPKAAKRCESRSTVITCTTRDEQATGEMAGD